MPDELLPLFPLDLVLLPMAPLPLHIFEERYKQMIGECLTAQREFGVVRAHENSMETIGCTAEILKVLKRYPDGRLDILTAGAHPFEILAVNHDLTYLRAEWAALEDEEEGEPETDSAQQVLILFSQVVELLSQRNAPEGEFRPDAAFLSFKLATHLPLDDDSKQHLLGLHSESTRLHALNEYLSNLLPHLERAKRLRKRAGGDGHLR